MNRTLDYISRQLSEAIKTVQPSVRNEYNKVVLTTKSDLITIQKQVNSLKSSSKSMGV